MNYKRISTNSKLLKKRIKLKDYKQAFGTGTQQHCEDHTYDTNGNVLCSDRYTFDDDGNQICYDWICY